MALPSCLNCGAVAPSTGGANRVCEFCGSASFAESAEERAHDNPFPQELAIAFENDGRWQDALRAWNTLLERRPTSARAWIGKGLAESMLMTNKTWSDIPLLTALERGHTNRTTDEEFVQFAIPAVGRFADYSLDLAQAEFREWRTRCGGAWDMFLVRIQRVLGVLCTVGAWIPESAEIPRQTIRLAGLLLWPERLGVGPAGEGGLPRASECEDAALIQLHDAALAAMSADSKPREPGSTIAGPRKNVSCPGSRNASKTCIGAGSRSTSSEPAPGPVHTWSSVLSWPTASWPSRHGSEAMCLH